MRPMIASVPIALRQTPFDIFWTTAAAATELTSRLATRATGASGRQGPLRGAAALRFSLALRPSLDLLCRRRPCSPSWT